MVYFNGKAERDFENAKTNSDNPMLVSDNRRIVVVDEISPNFISF